MSLSKYYKSSDSFQPERIVKHDDPEQQKWKRSEVPQVTESKIAKNTGPGSGADEISAHESTEPENVPDQTNVSPEALSTAAAGDVSTDGLTFAQGEQPGVDLSNYMEVAVAESKIEDAYQRGMQEGVVKAEQDFGDTQRALLNSCQQLDTIRETLIKNSRSEVLEFAMAIAERIVRISVREQDRTIIATIDEALQQAVKSDEFTIYLHPLDYETVSTKTEELIAGLSGLNNIVVKQDNTIEQGGAKIESDNCTIDSTIATQFDVIREELSKKI